MVAGKDWTKEQISGLEAGYLKVMKERGGQLGLLVEEGTGKAGVRAELRIHIQSRISRLWSYSVHQK